jgi:hypothetical protein
MNSASPLPRGQSQAQQAQAEAHAQAFHRLQELQQSLPKSVSSALSRGAEIGRPPASDAANESGGPGSLLPLSLRAVDQLLHGGLPRGVLVEVTGRRSSGRFTLVLHALASATQSGESAALIDLGDHLDPQSAVDQGVALERLLWLRPRELKDALTSAETVLAAGFSLVVLDLGMRIRKGSLSRTRLDGAWLRLARAAARQRAGLLVSSPYRISGTAAGIVVGAESARPRWKGNAGAPSLLTGLSTQLTLEKQRGRRPGETSLLMLTAKDALLFETDAAGSASARVDSKNNRTDQTFSRKLGRA